MNKIPGTVEYPGTLHLKCSKCGGRLFYSAARDTIFVHPCEDCLSRGVDEELESVSITPITLDLGSLETIEMTIDGVHRSYRRNPTPEDGRGHYLLEPEGS